MGRSPRSKAYDGVQSASSEHGPEPLLFRAAGLYKTYQHVAILERLELKLNAGEILAVTGSNGTGKSTLLKCLAGATSLDDGVITIRGERSHPSSADHWRSVFGILDDFTWLPDLTITDHLMLMSTDQNVDSTRQALTSFGVGELGDRLPDSLSAGQRQRAILATTHVRPWTVLLLDEPERHLDTDGIQLLAHELTSLVNGQNRCVVVASHSPKLVQLLGCAVMDLSRVTEQDHR